MHRFFPDKSEKFTNTMGTFKQKKSFATRREEVESIRAKFPTKIPVIVERFPKETQLPILDKTKFLVPQELAISQFLTIIRGRLYPAVCEAQRSQGPHSSYMNRMHLGPTQAFYLLINNKNMASMSKTIAEVYLENKDEDGFLYVTYASQEMFGCSSSVTEWKRSPFIV